jgi:hypothetical protein
MEGRMDGLMDGRAVGGWVGWIKCIPRLFEQPTAKMQDKHVVTVVFNSITHRDFRPAYT